MYAVVAKCGYLYGVVDTDDKVVEWMDEKTIYEYVNQNVEIDGVSGEGIVVNPIFYIPYQDVLCGGSESIFNTISDTSKGYQNRGEFVSNGKKYKFRMLSEVSEGSQVSLQTFNFTADISGYLIKLSNGLCTILPKDVYTELFDGLIDLSMYID